LPLASVGGQNSSSAMKAIARTLLAVILVQQWCRFVISKENNKLVSSQQKDKQRSTLPINVNMQ
jgi:hypothetical protein